MTSKYGFVILLDALGTRTANLDRAAEYLKQIDEIERDIRSALRATLSKKIESKLFNELSIRFFGDTLLITYEIKDPKKEAEYFDRISFVLRLFLCRALAMGLMFRGSMSIGDYVDRESVVLGPAVTDAANWYEQLDMMGVLLTPHTGFCLKDMHFEKDPAPWVFVWSGDAVLERPPMKSEKTAPELYVLNWVSGSPEEKKLGGELKWFYSTIRKFEVPAGVESKFANTEAFFLRHYEQVREGRQTRGAAELASQKKKTAGKASGNKG